MTAERIKEIRQMLEACHETDATDWDAEKTGVVAELLTAVDETADRYSSHAASVN
jgi:hypothetical protein